jgi:cell division protein FtsN
MTKDYAKRRRNQHLSRRQAPDVKQSAIPGWIWMSAGLFLGVGLSGVMYWKLHKTQTLPQNTIVDIHEDTSPTPTIERKPLKKPKQVAAANPLDVAKSSSRFDFYTVLPSMHTKAQNADPSLSADQTLDMALQKDLKTPHQTALIDDEPDISTLPQKVANTPPPGNYFIQAGSFRRLEQAEEMKAQLAITGFEASIQTFKMGDRDNRYRVLIGPFSSKDQAQNQQMHLEQALQLHSVVLKITV